MAMQISTLKPNEPAVVAPQAIDLLQSSLGETASRDIVERAAFELSERLGILEEALMKGDLDAVGAAAARMGGIADNLGMVQVAQISRDLAFVVKQRDLVAIAAVSRRLHRVGETSIFSVIDHIGHGAPA